MKNAEDCVSNRYCTYKPKDRGLEALYDRFILRLCVGYIESEDNFFDMIDGESSSEFALDDETKKLQITNEELAEWKTQIDTGTLSEEAKAVISAIRKELTARNEKLSEENKDSKDSEWQRELFEVGDRRWKKIAHILKASAFLNDRTEVDLMDCQLIEYCIWSTEKQQKMARDIVEKCIKQNGLDCDTAIEEINEQIEEFTAAVYGQWFEEVPPPKQHTMKDGHKAYKIVNPAQITSFRNIKPAYLCEEYVHENYDRKGAYYDDNCNFIGDYDYYFEDDTFEIIGNNAKWTDGDSGNGYSFEIETAGVPEPKKFSDIAHETLQKNFDKEQYAPIVDRIQSEIKTLKDKKEADAVPFKANLFANQEYNTSITAKVDDAIQQLEDAKVSLDKQRNRYFKAELAATLSVGDVILRNGIVYTADEIENLTDEQKADVIAVVCVADEKTYALGIEQYSDAWDKIAKIASDYGTDNNLPTAYASGWTVPDKDLLAKIYENRETVNKSLKVVGEDAYTLDRKEYWTSTENGDSAAFYQIFDDEGNILSPLSRQKFYKNSDLSCL